MKSCSRLLSSHLTRSHSRLPGLAQQNTKHYKATQRNIRFFSSSPISSTSEVQNTIQDSTAQLDDKNAPMEFAQVADSTTQVMSSADATTSAVLDSGVLDNAPLVLPPGVELGFKTLFTAPVDFVVCCADAIHSSTGSPWWVSILIFAGASRVVLAPIVVKQQTTALRMKQAAPRLRLVQENISSLKERGASKEEQQKALQGLFEVYKKYKVNPISMLAPMLVQIPVSLFCFWGISRLCTYEALANGGAYWFTDLTVSDPTYMLGVGTGLLMLSHVQLGMEMQDNPGSNISAADMKKVASLFSCMIIPASMFLPSGAVLYFGGSAGTILLQSLVMKIPFIKHQLVTKHAVADGTEATLASDMTTEGTVRSSRRARRRRNRETPPKSTP